MADLVPDADDLIVAFRDIDPVAPTHVLLIPRAHIGSAAELTEEHSALLGRMFGVAACLAANEALAERGYRLVTNIGEDGGQSVAHLHLHLLGGRRMTWPPG